MLTGGKKNEIITQDAIKKIMDYESLSTLIKAYEDAAYTPAEEIRELIILSRESEKESTRLAALKQLRSIRLEIIRNAGLVVTATKSLPDGLGGGHTTLSTTKLIEMLNDNNGEKDGRQSERTESTDRRISSVESSNGRSHNSADNGECKEEHDPGQHQSISSGVGAGSSSPSGAGVGDSGPEGEEGTSARGDGKHGREQSSGASGEKYGSDGSDTNDSGGDSSRGQRVGIPTVLNRPPISGSSLGGLAKGGRGYSKGS